MVDVLSHGMAWHAAGKKDMHGMEDYGNPAKTRWCFGALGSAFKPSGTRPGTLFGPEGLLLTTTTTTILVATD